MVLPPNRCRHPSPDQAVNQLPIFLRRQHRHLERKGRGLHCFIIPSRRYRSLCGRHTVLLIQPRFNHNIKRTVL
nr:hypothetical protein [Tawny frogmouth aviadenovirus A]